MKKIMAWISAAALSALLPGLSGCATPPRTVLLTGEEAPSAERTARLIVPYTLDILTVDGDEFSPGVTLRVHRGHRLILDPGPHTMVVRYRDFFETNTDDMVRVEGTPRQITFTLQEGQSYAVRHPEFADPEDARAARGQLPLWIEEARKGRIDSETETVPNPRARFALIGDGSDHPAVAMPAEGENIQPTAPVETESEGISSLDLLKFWWNKSTEAERGAFKKWIDQ